MAPDSDLRLLTSPRIFLVGMAAFLILVGFVVLILYKQIALAFGANPGLNGLIVGVLAIGSLFAFRQVFRLFREIRWVNSLVSPGRAGRAGRRALLGPMATLLDAGAGARGLSTHDDPRDPQFGRHPPRRGARAQPLSRRPADFPRPARHLLGPVGDGPFDQRRDRQHEDRRRHDDDVRRSQERPFGADRRHERFVHLVAVRPGRLAGPRLSRPSGRAGAEPLLHRAGGLSGQPCRDQPAGRTRRARRGPAADAETLDERKGVAAMASLAEGIRRW